MTSPIKDEYTKHNQLLEKTEEKILDFQRTLDKLKALQLNATANSLSCSPSKSSGFLELNNQQGSGKEPDCGVSCETYKDGWEAEHEEEDEGEDGELDSENDSDEGEDEELDNKSNSEDGHYDDFVGDEDARPCFPCPFCYMEIELYSLCNHLQEEHCFDWKNAVCPLCAANLGKDVIGHFIVQHASSLKRRRKSQKSCVWPGSPATLGRELSSFIGSSNSGRGNARESAPDPCLSTFLCNASISNTKDFQRDKFSNDDATIASNSKRMEPPLLDKDHEHNTRERKQRAAFVQQLIMSTIF